MSDINLDAMTDEELKAAQVAFSLYVAYIDHLRVARGERLAGNIRDALLAEQKADEIYCRLPKEYIW
ncbi:MAG: hypothetical protein EOM24_16240 [Chloroflexia bacterium]|nr:hypothetical protein [Chloroflexia bacterium]